MAPFYAVEVSSSALGTKGGPRTDVDGRVLDVDGDVIEGLYAAGNVMANPSGMVYGGAGATLPSREYGGSLQVGLLSRTGSRRVPKRGRPEWTRRQANSSKRWTHRLLTCRTIHL